jgi:BirA family biotin operon repressor/biotin-[acetyl-CoA-carboxylase] ligase
VPESNAWTIHRFPILASTNQLALDWMASGHANAGTVLVADEQTSGRGRHGRSWSSGKGALLMTAVLPFSFQPDRLGWFSLAAGLAAANALEDLGVPAQVKWPNDVLLNGRKVAGILVETNRPDLAAVGIGLNIANALPPDAELLQPATRLRDFLPDASVDATLSAVLAHLAATWDLLQRDDIPTLRAAWEARDATVGRRIVWSNWNEGDQSGEALGVAEDGGLRIRLTGGREEIARVGEIRFAAD